MSHVVDVWTNPPEPSLLEGVPEIARLIGELSGPEVKDMSQQFLKGSAKLGADGMKYLLEDGGVSKVLMSAWQRPGKVCCSNESVLEYVKADPHKFVGIGTVNLTNPMEAVTTVDKCVKEYGFKGIRILPWLWNMPPTTNYYYPVFAKCVELDVPFLTQVGHTGPLCPSEPGRPIPYIDQVALDFPDLKIVCGHIGYPWTNEMIGVAWKHPNVYIDTSAHSPQYYPEELIKYMTSYGSGKVMFGTNFPQVMYKRAVKEARKLPLSEETMDKFMWKNANEVFKLGMEEQVNVKAKM